MNLNSLMINLFDRMDGFYDKHLSRIEHTDSYKKYENLIYNATFLIPFVGAYRVTRNCWRLNPVLQDALSPEKEIYRIESEEELKELKRLRRMVACFAFPTALRVAQFRILMYALNSKSPLELAFYSLLFLVGESTGTYLEIVYTRETKNALSEILSKK